MSAGLCSGTFRNQRWGLLLKREAEVNLLDPRRNGDAVVIFHIHRFVQGEWRDETRGRKRVVEDRRRLWWRLRRSRSGRRRRCLDLG